MLCKTWGSGYPDPLRTMAVVGVPNQAQATNGPQGSPRFVVAQIALGVNGQDQVVVSRTACAPTSKRLQLSAKGLRSGVTDFGNKWKCPVPASVLIRVRAAFARPVTLESCTGRELSPDRHGTDLERLAGHHDEGRDSDRVRVRRQGRRGRHLRRQAPLPAEPVLRATALIAIGLAVRGRRRQRRDGSKPRASSTARCSAASRCRRSRSCAVSLDVHASPRLGSQSPYAEREQRRGWTHQGDQSFHLDGADTSASETGLAALSRVSCGRTSLRIPLSSKGLRGGKTTVLGDRFYVRGAGHDPHPAARGLPQPGDVQPVSRKPGPSTSPRAGSAQARWPSPRRARSPIAFATVDDATGEASIFVAKPRCRTAD